MSLIADIPADPDSIHVGRPPTGAAALDKLAKDLGPTVTYDLTPDGPVTQTKSFAGHKEYAIVLGKYAQVSSDTVRRTVESLHLGIPVIILRSCVSRPELQRIQHEIVAQLISLDVSFAASISTARGQVEVKVSPARYVRMLRHKYGDRVHAQLGWVVATTLHVAIERSSLCEHGESRRVHLAHLDELVDATRHGSPARPQGVPKVGTGFDVKA